MKGFDSRLYPRYNTKQVLCQFIVGGKASLQK